jgi:hypothetical protein
MNDPGDDISPDFVGPPMSATQFAVVSGHAEGGELLVVLGVTADEGTHHVLPITSGTARDIAGRLVDVADRVDELTGP